MPSLSVTPPTPPTPELAKLLDVAQKIGGPQTDDIPTWAGALGKFYMAPAGVLPDIFPGGISPGFPSGGPDLFTGAWIAVGQATAPGAQVRVLNEDNEPTALDIPAIGSSGQGVAWQPNGQRIAIANSAPYAVISALTGEVESGWPALDGSGAGQCVAWSPDGSKLAVGRFGNTQSLSVIDVATKTLETGWPHISRTHGVAWSPDGSKLAAAERDVFAGPEGIRVIDVATKTLDGGYANLGDQAWCCAWSPDGSMLAVGTENDNGGYAIYDTSTGAKIAGFPALAQLVRGVAWSPDGSTLALCGNISNLLIVDVATKADVGGYSQPSGNPQRAAFSSDGQRLAITHSSGSGLTVYNTDTWATETGWPTTEGAGLGVAFAYDPGNVASG